MKEEFEKAARDVQNLSEKPSNEILLSLYALYKQATEGDVTGERPGGFDFKGAAKHDAWASLQGTDRDTAMKNYVELVNKLLAK